MELDIDLLFKPEEPKPSRDGVYDEVEEMEKWAEYQAEIEHEYHARSAEEKRDDAWWKIITNWNRNHSIGAGILLYLDGGEWL